MATITNKEAAVMAEMLVKEYFDSIYAAHTIFTWEQAKAEKAPQVGYCKTSARIAIDNLILTLNVLDKPEYVTFLMKDPDGDWYNGYSLKDYYEEVKLEINKL